MYLVNFSVIFKGHSKTGPFTNWTHVDHFSTRLVNFSDDDFYFFIGSAHGTSAQSLVPDDLNIEDLFQDDDSNVPGQVRFF
jgi:hypothetical protein